MTTDIVKKPIVTASDIHFALWDRVVEHLEEVMNRPSEEEALSPSAMKDYILDDIAHSGEITWKWREYISMHSDCVLCSVETMCSRCPLAKEYGRNGCSDTVYRGLCLSLEQACAAAKPEQRYKLVKKAIAYAKKIRDVPLPDKYNTDFGELVGLEEDGEGEEE